MDFQWLSVVAALLWDRKDTQKIFFICIDDPKLKELEDVAGDWSKALPGEVDMLSSNSKLGA